MALLIDPPSAPGHGTTWSHLASDTSLQELHDFAARSGIPERGFDGDHYDIPAHLYDAVVAAGARPVGSRELLAAINAAGLRSRKAARLRARKPGRELLWPPLLRAGDLVAVVTPAGSVSDDRLAAGITVLESWGLRIRAEVGVSGDDLPWLAGSDAERAAAFTRAWADPEVAALWTGRGGFGSQRILDLLDWRMLTMSRPRWLVGFSDITALHQAVAGRLGVVSAHGPGVAGLSDAGAAESVRHLLFEGTLSPVVGRRGATGGVAEGVLVGGNLTMLASGIGTAFVHSARDSIAVLEDVGERPFRLDRVLTQLLRSGWFEGARGVVCGQFSQCGDPGEVAALLAARLEPLGLPILYDAPIGHEPRSVSLPLGALARLDAAAGVLSLVGGAGRGPAPSASA